jgi:hypothetical protein
MKGVKPSVFPQGPCTDLRTFLDKSDMTSQCEGCKLYSVTGARCEEHAGTTIAQVVTGLARRPGAAQGACEPWLAAALARSGSSPRSQRMYVTSAVALHPRPLICQQKLESLGERLRVRCRPPEPSPPHLMQANVPSTSAATPRAACSHGRLDNPAAATRPAREQPSLRAPAPAHWGTPRRDSAGPCAPPCAPPRCAACSRVCYPTPSWQRRSPPGPPRAGCSPTRCRTTRQPSPCRRPARDAPCT